MAKEPEQISVNVPIDVTDLDKAFAELVIKSKLGKVIEEEIQAVVAPGHYIRLTTVIQDAVKTAVGQAVTKIVQDKVDEHRETIVACVSERVTDEFIISTVGKHWDRVMENM